LALGPETFGEIIMPRSSSIRLFDRIGHRGGVVAEKIVLL
jgi:hypothetical protein